MGLEAPVNSSLRNHLKTFQSFFGLNILYYLYSVSRRKRRRRKMSSNSTSSSWKPWPVESVLRSLTRNLNLSTGAPSNNNNNNNNGNYRSASTGRPAWSSFLRQWPSPSVMASGIGVNISLLSQHQGRANAATTTSTTRPPPLPQPVKTAANNNNSKRRSSSTSFDSCLSATDNNYQQVWPSFERPTHHSSSSSSCSSASYSKLWSIDDTRSKI